ncbi:uncharacterized protein LOC130696350 [Daphnia carinata]|uniref:uncharacterized protein LOC130696350 n=1 Tax=Daphnia carinata TaxID=120202 RepID=UPI00257E7EC1|nr:uncharacterized protein LOC130696350 [Daphnia carinata]
MLPVCPSKVILMMMVVITCSALQNEASERMVRPGYPGMQYGNNYYGGSNNNGVYYNQGAISPFPLFLDSSCRRYNCVSKPGMRTGSCDMTCSPDRTTPQCPVINCVSASAGTCGNMRCEVVTYSHVLY